jgi:GNAT superfamily N-acetyltransferase
MPVSEPFIRAIVVEDRDAWLPLWAGYQAFYERTVSREVTEATWARLTQTGDVCGFLAFNTEEGTALGLVHYLFHPSTSKLGSNCYLPDLFVVPAARGQRIGRQLIARVTEAARARGAEVLYWQTEEFNGTARRLYERVAKRSPFIRYQLEL